ncbi:MAG TPA: hypothetical protein VIE15_00115 [Acidimicrobiales bacterium]
MDAAKRTSPSQRDGRDDDGVEEHDTVSDTGVDGGVDAPNEGPGDAPEGAGNEA